MKRWAEGHRRFSRLVPAAAAPGSPDFDITWCGLPDAAMTIGSGATMGHWGVKSFENDDASDALDAAFERVHGTRYESLMDDRNPLSYEQVQAQLANPETLELALGWLVEEFGDNYDDWDDEARLAYAGVVVRHAELHVAIPDDVRRRALAWLNCEAIDWDEATKRRLRREQELDVLRRNALKTDGG
jgi:hypothetical protein